MRSELFLGFLPLGVPGTWRKGQFPLVRRIQSKPFLQLRAKGLSGRSIAASQQISRNSFAAVREAADAARLGQEDVADLPDAKVYSRLFPGRGEHESVIAEPDWAELQREIARVEVAMKLVHVESTDRCASSSSPVIGYDRLCKRYQQHVLVAGLASRVGHEAEQTVEVDWSGPTMQLRAR